MPPLWRAPCSPTESVVAWAANSPAAVGSGDGRLHTRSAGAPWKRPNFSLTRFVWFPRALIHV
jgi:hypothetical protein